MLLGTGKQAERTDVGQKRHGISEEPCGERKLQAEECGETIHMGLSHEFATCEEKRSGVRVADKYSSELQDPSEWGFPVKLQWDCSEKYRQV